MSDVRLKSLPIDEASEDLGNSKFITYRNEKRAELLGPIRLKCEDLAKPVDGDGIILQNDVNAAMGRGSKSGCIN